MGDQHALLMLDLVDSTRLSEQLGDHEASVLWAAHDQMARDLLVEWRGREIDKSDGFLLVFADAADAVGYALAYHGALPALHAELAARVGIHVGELIARDNAPEHIARGAKPVEMEGIAKSATARVMAIAQAGQTLLTAAARAALGPAAAKQAHSHGHWRMKGLAEPVEIFEVGAAGAAFTPPPDSAKSYRVVPHGDFWLPLREVRHSLPAERDSFVGRQQALQDLARHFDAGARLVSILGAGGSGKTRLAKRYGWTWLGDFPGGVWFCDLAQATTIDGIAYAVGQGLDVPLSGADPLGQLAYAIAGRGACLVILDNYEQVARHAEATLGRWLDRAADARFIVTSREALGIVGEEAMVLDPLPSGEGSALFLQRAAAARSGYEPLSDNRMVVEPLVKLLDGLPLAIELAAARVRVMSPRMLLDRMSERFKLLASSGGRPDRQATLRATLDWSWELLSEPEKMALAQLSVFEGGFTLEAAEAVVDLSACGAHAPWVADMVQALVEKSLVQASGERRFHLLSTLQLYATERLRCQNAEEASNTDTIRRHWLYFSAIEEKQATAHGCVDADNIVAACRRATAAQDGRSAAAALRLAWAVIKLRGPSDVAVQLAAAVEAIDNGLQPEDRAVAQWISGLALHSVGQGTAAALQFESALEIARSRQNFHLEAGIFAGMAQYHFTAGRIKDSKDYLLQAQALLNRCRDDLLMCQVLNDLGTIASIERRLQDSKDLYDSALELAIKNGNQRWEGGLLGNLGNLYFEQGLLAEAEQHHQAALHLAKNAGDSRWEGNAHCNLGMVYHTQKRFDSALHEFDVALSIAKTIGHIRLEAVVSCNLGLLARETGNLESSKESYDRAIRIAVLVGDRRSEAQFLVYMGELHARLEDFSAAIICFKRSEEILQFVNDDLLSAHSMARRASAEVKMDAARVAKQTVSDLITLLDTIVVEPGSELEEALVNLSDLVPQEFTYCR